VDGIIQIVNKKAQSHSPIHNYTYTHKQTYSLSLTHTHTHTVRDRQFSRANVLSVVEDDTSQIQLIAPLVLLIMSSVVRAVWQADDIPFIPAGMLVYVFLCECV
jgi:uncharacterized membrane protein YkgB